MHFLTTIQVQDWVAYAEKNQTWKYFWARKFKLYFFKHKQPNPAPEWLSENAWSDIVWATRLLRSLQNFMDHFREHIKAWKRFYDSTNPQDEELPEGMQKVE